MPGGKFDSSKTRVRPVFDALWTGGRDWLPELLALPSGGCPDAAFAAGDLTLVNGYLRPTSNAQAAGVASFRLIQMSRGVRKHHSTATLVGGWRMAIRQLSRELCAY
jgi:hypothetical protein